MPSLLLLPDAPHFTIAAVNTAYLKVTGKTESNLVGKTIAEAFSGDVERPAMNTVHTLITSLETALETRQPQKATVLHYEVQGTYPGDLKDWNGAAENIPIPDDEGKIIFINHVLTEVTREILWQEKQGKDGELPVLKHLNGRAAFSERKLVDINGAIANRGALINSTDDLTWSVTNNFKLVDANNAFIERLEVMAGFTLQPGDDLMMREIFPEDLLAFWKEHYNKALCGESFKKEVHLPAFNRTKESWSEINFSPVYESGVIAGIACYSRNITERKSAEEANRFKAELLNTIGQALIATGPDGAITLWNKAAEDLYGWPASEAIGKNVVDLIPAEQTKEQANEIMKELLQGHSWSGEFMVQRKDGLSFPVYVTDAPIFDRSNQLSGIIGISADISKQKNTGAKINNTEQRYRTLFEQNLAGFYQTTKNGVIVNCNDAFAKMLKYNSQKELLAMNANELYFSAADRKEFIENIIDQKKLNNYEGVLKCKDGSPLYCLENISLARDDVTGEVFFNGILIDITERKKAEDKLLTTSNELQRALTEQGLLQKKTEASEKRFRQIVETAQEGIWLIDENDYTIFINEKMCDIIEYTASELVGRKIYHFMDDESARNSLEQIERRKQGLNEIHDSVFVTKSGKDVWVNISTNPIFDEDGKYKGALAMVTDITERKQAELLLTESNERFINITRATFDAIWDWDLLANDIYWGEGFKTIFGYKLLDLQTGIHSWTDHIHKDDIERVSKGIYEFMEGPDTNWMDEYRFLKADATYAIVVDRCVKIKDKKGKAIRMVGAMQDITARKELENLLDKATKLARIGSWEIDLSKDVVYWSAITKEIHEADADFTPNVQTGINFFKEGESRSLITQKIRDAIEKGIYFDVELQIITAKGNEKWIRSIGESEFLDGKCVRVYGSLQDVDVLKTAELAAIENLKEKNIILESIGDAFFAVNKNWIVTYWNSQAERVMGKSRTDIINLNLWEVYPDLIDSEIYRKYHEAIATNQAIHTENYFEPLSSWFEVSAYPSVNGLSVYFKDITHRKSSGIRLRKLNESLQAKAQQLAISNAELEQFAYVASHDLQEPLRMVAGFLTQLEKKYADIIDDTGKKYIGFAVDGAKRMRQIILDLLEFSRVGRMEDKIQLVDLNEITGEILMLFRKQIDDKNAQIQIGKLPVIRSYKAPLRQVFQNLIGNALKYSRKNTPPQIRITAKKLINHWQFSIADNGIGIDEEYFDKIFILFQRLHGKSEFSGTGMGLAVTKKIIDNLGGKIWLESKEGKGSTFYFTLLKLKL